MAEPFKSVPRQRPYPKIVIPVTLAPDIAMQDAAEELIALAHRLNVGHLSRTLRTQDHDQPPVALASTFSQIPFLVYGDDTAADVAKRIAHNKEQLDKMALRQSLTGGKEPS